MSVYGAYTAGCLYHLQARVTRQCTGLCLEGRSLMGHPEDAFVRQRTTNAIDTRRVANGSNSGRRLTSLELRYGSSL